MRRGRRRWHRASCQLPEALLHFRELLIDRPTLFIDGSLQLLALRAPLVGEHLHRIAEQSAVGLARLHRRQRGSNGLHTFVKKQFELLVDRLTLLLDGPLDFCPAVDAFLPEHVANDLGQSAGVLLVSAKKVQLKMLTNALVDGGQPIYRPSLLLNLAGLARLRVHGRGARPCGHDSTPRAPRARHRSR